LTPRDLKNLKVLADRGEDGTYTVTLIWLGGPPRTGYVENPGQVVYYKAADRALQALSR
jgi:hypothetical protein